jgi:hypothetical protein
MSHTPPAANGNAGGPPEDEMARLRRTVEAQAAALANLALTAQLLAEQVEDMRRSQQPKAPPGTPPE